MAEDAPPLPVRAVPAKTKPLPMEQLQVIQSFLHAVPQGRKMVEEVSEGAGQGQCREHSHPHGGVPSSPGTPCSHSWLIILFTRFSSVCHPLPLALRPPCCCPLAPALVLAPGGQSHHCLC